jgi:arylsulfatase A-like enzyme
VSVLLTVTSHPPFVNPGSGRVDPERTFRYVDAQIGQFHDELQRRGFFGDGVLLVLGDHRTMTPLHAAEYRAHGDRAFARIPLVVVGAVRMPPVVETAFQQSDILPSITALLGAGECRSPFAGDFLRPDPQPPRYVVHARGDDRDRVDVYWGEDGIAGFRLDGDASGWIDGAPPDADAVAAWIDTQRRRAASSAAASKPDAGG